MSGCAIGPDGELLNAKDIKWYKDGDLSEPINQATSSSATTPNSSTTIHPFFRGGPAPAVVITGTHHSGWATHPSNRIIDPNNAETLPSATMHKCKASGSIAAGHHVNHKFTADDERSTDGGESDDYEPDVTEHPATTSDDEAGDTEPEEDINLAYASTKAMGDADCEVSIFSSL